MENLRSCKFIDTLYLDLGLPGCPNCWQKATTRASSTVPREEDTSGDMVGVLVHLIDKSSQMLDFCLVEGELRKLIAARGFTPTKICGMQEL